MKKEITVNADKKLNGKVITKRADGSIRVATYNSEPSKTDQQFKDDVNVNNVIAKYMRTRDARVLGSRVGQYADLTKLTDLSGAMNQVLMARDAFESLPSKLRQRFGHDPLAFVEYMQDPSNHKEAIELGLMVEKTPILSSDDPPLVHPKPGPDAQPPAGTKASKGRGSPPSPPP